jgi:hypothetical protein
MEILLGTNAECTRNFSHGIIPLFIIHRQEYLSHDETKNLVQKPFCRFD